MNPIEAVAVFFGLLSVWFTVKENILCWPFGLVSVFLFIFIFYDTKLYSDAILQVIYVFLQIYGWRHWLTGGMGKTELSVTTLTPFAIGGWAGAAVSFSTVWGALMHRFTDAALPFADAFIVGASLVAQLLMTRKKLESWFFWILVDIVAVWVYAAKGLHLTAGLYAVFLVLATAGFFEWRKSRQNALTMDES